MSTGGRKIETRKASASSADGCRICGEMELRDQKTSEVKWVECDVCQKWHHIACIGLDDKDYDFLKRAKKSNKHIFWLCNDCKVASFEVIKAISELKEKQERTEKEICIMKSETAKLECGVEKLKAGVEKIESKQDKMEVVVSQLKHEVDDIKKTNNSLRSEVDTSLAEVVKGELNKKMHEVENNMQHVQQTLQETKAKTDEMTDHESRRNNIIIYNVPEVSGPTSDIRYNSDMDFCMKLFTELVTGCAKEDIKRMTRLGQRQDNGRERALLIEFHDRTVKNIIMESLNKLRMLEEKFKKVVVVHDMTPKERQECKEMVQEARRLESQESGDFIYRVRGSPGMMKIIKIRKRM